MRNSAGTDTYGARGFIPRAAIRVLSATFAGALVGGAMTVATVVVDERAARAQEADEEDGEPIGATSRSRGRLEEIVVTAQKREQSIQDVPISMTALTSDFVLDSGLTSFGGIQQYAPNVSINPVTDTRSTALRIRGIGSDQTNAGIDSSVGVFLDGIYQGRTGLAASAGLLDIERIEVLRGPQGTLFGKNTAAGAFNITTKKPNFDGPASMLELVYGSYNQREIRGWINLPIVDDRIATRIAGYVTRRDFFDDNLSGNGRNDGDSNGFRSHTRFFLTDDLELLVSADYGTNQDQCCVPDIVDYNGPPNLDTTFGKFTSPDGNPVGSLSESTGRPLPTKVDPFDRTLDANTPAINSTTLWGVTLDLNYDLNDYGIRLLTAHRRFKSLSQFDGDFSSYDAVLLRTDEQFQQWSTELQLISPGGEDLEYVLGAYFYYQKDDTKGKLAVLPEWLDAGPVFGAALEGSAVDGEAFNLDTNRHQTWSYALFGQGTYHFDEQWSLIAGLRSTFEKKKREGSQIATLNTIPAGPFGPDQHNNEEPLEVWNFSPMVVLNYAPTEDSMIFGKFARGFKSGGFNQQRVPEGVSTEFDDEEATDFEIGVRSSWFDQMLTANVTGFYTIYDKFQAQAFDGTALTVTNAGKLTSYGLEADVFMAPHETTTIGAALGWNVADYDDFKNSPCTAEQTFAHRLSNGNIYLDDPNDLVCDDNDLSGRRLDNAPRVTASFFTQIVYPISDFGVFDYPILGRVRLEYSYRDFIYLTQDLDPNLTQSPTHLLNLRLGLAPDDARWDFALWTQNLLNQGYGVVGFDVPITSGYAVINGPPRTYGATLRLFF